MCINYKKKSKFQYLKLKFSCTLPCLLFIIAQKKEKKEKQLILIL